MSQLTSHSTTNPNETAIIVGVNSQEEDQFDFTSTMEELKALSETCRLTVEAQFEQNREHFDHKYLSLIHI